MWFRSIFLMTADQVHIGSRFKFEERIILSLDWSCCTKSNPILDLNLLDHHQIQGIKFLNQFEWTETYLWNEKTSLKKHCQHRDCTKALHCICWNFIVEVAVWLAKVVNDALTEVLVWWNLMLGEVSTVWIGTGAVVSARPLSCSVHMTMCARKGIAVQRANKATLFLQRAFHFCREIAVIVSQNGT